MIYFPVKEGKEKASFKYMQVNNCRNSNYIPQDGNEK